MVDVNSKGEVVNVAEADQFQPAKSQYECGYFACFIAASMAKPGETPVLNTNQIIDAAERAYAQYDGSDAASNKDGMTNEQEYELLHQIGLHYQEIAPDISQVKAWVQAGYPVLLAVTEASVHDLALDGANPYPWTPTGTHIIFTTGVQDNDVLVRDSANVSSLSNPGSLRPGPRPYDASRLQLVGATVAVPPWRPRPASATAIPADDQHIPSGWSDNGQELTAPNGVKVSNGMRSYILTHTWNPADWPLAAVESVNPVEIGFSQPDGNNAGLRQLFMYTELCATTARGVYVASVGREFLTLEKTDKPAPVDAAARANVQAAARLIADTSTQLLADVAAL